MENANLNWMTTYRGTPMTKRKPPHGRFVLGFDRRSTQLLDECGHPLVICDTAIDLRGL